MVYIPYLDVNKGTFLVASPEIEDGVFFRSVVLLCEHAAIGSLGLIVNKPFDLEIPSSMLDLASLEKARFQIRLGGPIQPNEIMVLHTGESAAENSTRICDGVYLSGDLRFLHTPHSEFPEVLLCLGYGGWEAGALENELLQGIWFPFPASKSHLFATPPQAMWQTLLREMGGRYHTLSMMPENLDLN